MSESTLYHLPITFSRWFDLAHFITVARQVRKDLGQHHAREQPLVSCFTTVVSCFAGGLLNSFFLGKPMLASFENMEKVMLAVIIWFLINFCPGEAFLKLTMSSLNNIIIWSLKEVYRMHKVARGVSLGLATFPSTILPPIITGLSRATGTNVLRPFLYLMCGLTPFPTFSELHTPSVSTKVSAASASIWLLTLNIGATIPAEQVYVSLTIVMVCIKLYSLLTKQHHARLAKERKEEENIKND